MILLVGPPGSGKSTFCEQAILQNVSMNRPIIYVITEHDPSEAERALKERGLGEIEAGLLNFIDAYSETVGLSVRDRSDTVTADCASLSSIGIAISKAQERIGRKGALLVFDSLTSPYLLSGPEVVRFMRLTLSRFAGEGNSVLVCFDEGSSKEEDLVAMMSLSSGLIKMETEDRKRVLSVIKHPKVEPTSIEVPKGKVLEKLWDMRMWDEEIMTGTLRMMQGGAFAEVRREIGGFVNLFWPNLAHWSGILWDPKRFPEMMYELSKEHGEGMKEMMAVAPWHQRLLFRITMPKNLSKVKHMKKMVKLFQRMVKPTLGGIFEYLEGTSKIDEHYVRVHESCECMGFENVGTAMASMYPPAIAGMCKGLESWRGLERKWNATETKCIGLGDPYCEIKVVPGEIKELKDSLEKDISVLERIHERIMQHLMGFLLHKKPLVERPRLGSDVFFNAVFHTMVHPALAGERSRMAMRMGGAKAGKEVGERLMEAGLRKDEAVKRILNFMEHCKVGKVTVDETIRIKENCESAWTRFITKKREEPCCFFTTGFLNGFYSAVRNQHVKETRCIAMGDAYCEWEFT